MTVEDAATDRDILVLTKTVAADSFPVERAGVIGVDRESGRLERLTPFPWKGTDTDPPILRWSWIHARTTPADRDGRPESRNVTGEITATAYVDPKDGWRLRWPFVRAHLRGSLESMEQLARDGASTAGFVRAAVHESDILQLPLRLRFRCDSDDCQGPHELPILDQELHEMARLSRERSGQQWATRFRETWGRPLFERYDVHILVSAYAQSPVKFYVAGLFYPPRAIEDAHEHLHHVAHREHVRGEPAEP